MITGTHILFYSADAEADRAFFRDVLEFRAVDAGHGWLIFALPPAEAGVHPLEDGEKGTTEAARTNVYLMCVDVHATVASLEAKKVVCAPIVDEGWGIRTAIRLPSGAMIGLYQPRHPVAI